MTGVLMYNYDDFLTYYTSQKCLDRQGIFKKKEEVVVGYEI